MKKCANCQSDSLPDELRFCPECGAPLPEAPTRTEPEDGILLEARPVAAPEPAPNKKPKGKKRRSRRRRAAARLGLLAVCALGAVAAVVFVLVRVASRPKNDPIVYAQGSGVYTVSADGTGARQIRPAQYQDGIPAAAFASERPERLAFVCATADGGMSGLAYADLDSSKKDFIPIEPAEIAAFGLSPDGKTVWYRTGAGDLFLHDLSARRQLASGVEAVLFGQDWRSCVYQTWDGALYTVQTKAGAQPEKLADGVERLELLRGDYAVYTRLAETGEPSLVLCNIKNKTETVYENTEIAARFPQDGGLYFIQREQEPAALYTDPDAAQDARWVVDQGAKSEYGYPAGDWYYWFSFYQAQAREEVRGEVSAMTMQEYLLYSARMALRAQLAKSGGLPGTLYYFDGKTASAVDTGVLELLVPQGAQSSGETLLCVRVRRGGQPVSLNELAQEIQGSAKAIEYAGPQGTTRVEVTYLGDDPVQTEQEVARRVRETVNEKTELAAVKGTSVRAAGVGGAELSGDAGGAFFTLHAAAGGTQVYLLQTAPDGASGGALYKKELAQGSVAELVSENAGAVCCMPWGAISAQTDAANPMAMTLFVDGQQVGTGIEPWSVVLSNTSAELFYISGFDGLGGDLYRWRDGKSTLLCADAAQYAVLADGSALVLRAYNAKTGTGELALAGTRRGLTTLAQEVRGLMTATDSRYYTPYPALPGAEDAAG